MLRYRCQKHGHLGCDPEKVRPGALLLNFSDFGEVLTLRIQCSWSDTDTNHLSIDLHHDNVADEICVVNERLLPFETHQLPGGDGPRGQRLERLATWGLID